LAAALTAGLKRSEPQPDVPPAPPGMHVPPEQVPPAGGEHIPFSLAGVLLQAPVPLAQLSAVQSLLSSQVAAMQQTVPTQ
jgi:hypothetical protein